MKLSNLSLGKEPLYLRQDRPMRMAEWVGMIVVLMVPSCSEIQLNG